METSQDPQYARRYAQHLKAYIGLNMARLRHEQGRKQAAIAEDSGLSQPTISRMEHGRGRFTVAQVSAIAVALGVEVEVLQQRPPLPRP